MLRAFNVIYRNDDELSSYYNDNIVNQLSGNIMPDNIVITSGERDFAIKLKERIFSSGLNCSVFYLGKAINNEYDEYLISIFKAIEVSRNEVLIFDVDKEISYNLSANLDNNKVIALLWSHLKLLDGAAKSQSIMNVRSAIDASKSICLHIINQNIKSALLKSFALISNLISAEEDFLFGNEIRSLASFSLDSKNLIKINNIDELVNLNYTQLTSAFTSVKANISPIGTYDTSSIDARVSFLSSAIAFSRILNREISSNSLPKMFVWLSVYCLNLSIVYKRRYELTTALLLVIRALESYCQGLLIFANEASFDNFGRFFIGGRQTSGVGDIWDCACNKITAITSAGIDQTKIKNIVRLRNASLLGHGSIHCNVTMYNDAFTTIKNTIETIDNSYAPPPKQFTGLMNYYNSSVFGNLDKLVALVVSNEIALSEV